MKIDGTRKLRAPRERVYQCLSDPQVLLGCIPGCERLEKINENTYSATVRTGVGTNRGVFTGTARLENMRHPSHYRIVVEGKGTAGIIKGAGDLDLETQGQSTIIKYSGDLEVDGPIASAGQRMILGTAKILASQFFLAFDAVAKSAAGEPPPTVGFVRTALMRISAMLRRVFSPH